MKTRSRSKSIKLSAGLLCLIFFARAISAGTHKEYPFKYAIVDMPISLASGVIRTPEFTAKKSGWHDIMLLVDHPKTRLLSVHQQQRCMMGTTSGPLDLKDCGADSDPIVRAEWAVWDSEYVPAEPSAQFPPIATFGSLSTRIPHLVAHGEIPEGCGCKFTDAYNYKMLAGFSLEAGKKYVAVVRFTKDGSALNAANPHLIVIRHTDMW